VTAADLCVALACGQPRCPCARSARIGRGLTHCPVRGHGRGHGDRHPSLSVKQNERGKPLVHCHADCSQDAVIAALGERGLWDWPTMTPGARRTAGIPGPRLSGRTVPRAAFQGSQAVRGYRVRHGLRDLDGRLIAVHCREVDPATGKKLDSRVWWELPDGTRGLGGVPVDELPLYGSETLRDLPGEAEVYLTEGEPARDAMAWAGLPAVATVTGSAAIPKDEVLRSLLSFRVVPWPDADGPGATHMSRIAARLVVLGCPNVELIEPPAGAPRGWDAADLLRPFAEHRDHSAGRAAVEALPRQRWTPSAAEPQPPAGVEDFSLTHVGDLLAEPEEAVEWLVEDLLPMGGLAFLGAKPKVGKSTLSRNLALAVARGGEFLGRRCAQGTVIYLALEEKRSQVKRHFRLMGATGVTRSWSTSPRRRGTGWLPCSGSCGSAGRAWSSSTLCSGSPGSVTRRLTRR